jgi:hypothetical protein
MRKRTAAFCFAAWAVLGPGRAFAQFTAEEMADRAKWEDYLATAEFTGSTQIKGSQAVTSPWELTLKKGDIVRNALWKHPEGLMGGFIEGWQYEIAAYRLDKYLGLGMVPPTIERRFREDRGSLQLWIPDCMLLKEKMARKKSVPTNRLLAWNRAVYLQRAWDNLVANIDRHSGQILITPDWHMILIDHSRAFRSSKKYDTHLLFTETSRDGPKAMNALPRTFVDKLKSLTFEGVREAVGPYLSDAEIMAIMDRRDLILAEIDKLIKTNGEAQVLY